MESGIWNLVFFYLDRPDELDRELLSDDDEDVVDRVDVDVPDERVLELEPDDCTVVEERFVVPLLLLRAEALPVVLLLLEDTVDEEDVPEEDRELPVLLLLSDDE